MKKYLSLIVNAVLAGIAISLGGLIFLKVKDLFPGANIVGALLFAVGLFTVCSRGYALFTGKVCYLFRNKAVYLFDLILIWVGNLLGCMLVGWLINLTSLCGENGINSVAAAMADAKLASTPLSLFVLGFFCNIFIFIAVNGYANNPHELGKYLALIFGVVGFISAGTEHSVADMFYFCISNYLYTHTAAVLKALAFITLGNACGGVLLPLLEDLKDKVLSEKKK